LLLAFAVSELARWLSKLKIMRSRGAPDPMFGAVAQRTGELRQFRVKPSRGSLGRDEALDNELYIHSANH
jgi:hypothetical protein